MLQSKSIVRQIAEFKHGDKNSNTRRLRKNQKDFGRRIRAKKSAEGAIIRSALACQKMPERT